MPKQTDPQVIIPASYAHSYSLNSQFGDMDVLGHVNNLSVARYYESARARMHREIFGEKQYDFDNPKKIVLVENLTTYISEVHYPRSITVCSGIDHIGSSSYVVKQALFRDELCVGLCTATLVCLIHGEPLALDDKDRARLLVFSTKP